MSYFDFFARNSYIFDLGKSWNEQTPLELPPLSDMGEAFVPYSWFPDGHWLAGGSLDTEGIVIYSLESEQYRKLSDFGVAPYWTPDGRRLLFFSIRGRRLTCQ
jgi:Tol biopolymer transport system component